MIPSHKILKHTHSPQFYRRDSSKTKSVCFYVAYKTDRVLSGMIDMHMVEERLYVCVGVGWVCLCMREREREKKRGAHREHATERARNTRGRLQNERVKSNWRGEMESDK